MRTARNFLIDVSTNGINHLDRVVAADLPVNPNEYSCARLDEVDILGKILIPQLPCQVESSIFNCNSASLKFILHGGDHSDIGRHFRLYLSAEQENDLQTKPLVEVKEEYYQCQDSYRIETPTATYYFHKQGGGYASLIDREGLDWISYRPNGGSAGSYRGIPNIKNPEDYFHPGSVNAQSKILNQGPICCIIHTQTLNGECEAIWEVFPFYATMTLLKAPKPYWFLYEGTPGGKLEEMDGFIVRSDGTQTPAGKAWEAVLNPGWLYFGSPNNYSFLFFIQHKHEDKISSYWPMEHNMTVFGFGRQLLKHYLENVPARYTFGLLPSGCYENVRDQIEFIRQDVDIMVREANLE
jgi:hypothetical protein